MNEKMPADQRRRYASKREVAHLVRAARLAGLRVAGLEFVPGGAVRVLCADNVRGDLCGNFSDRLQLVAGCAQLKATEDSHGETV